MVNELKQVGGNYDAMDPSPNRDSGCIPVHHLVWASRSTGNGRRARSAYGMVARCAFGMFIHWGLYAIPAGTWPISYNDDGTPKRNGIPYPNTSEWIMAAANICPESPPQTCKTYEALVDQFNPIKLVNPDNPNQLQTTAAEWVRMAKDAGMHYLVITAKHHDGFAMWPTNVVDPNNPVRYSVRPDQDIIKALADECAKQGIRFGIYYSTLDWHHSAFRFPNDVTAWNDAASDCSGEWCYEAAPQNTGQGLPHG